MDKKDENRRIAIACQGGGSHTAFTAGVLKRIFKEEYEIVGLSGTSGGAICALLAWYGLLMNDRDKAIELLDSFWMDNSASSLWEKFLNEWVVTVSRMQGTVSLPEVSPYFYPPWAQNELRGMLGRQVDFEKIETLLKPSSPMLLISAVDVLSGRFRVFKNAEVTVDAILASAAIPTLFRAVHTDGGVYWDGLFSQNPPVRDLPDANPDEIWVVQINPERRENEPKSVHEILDRRNELAGNLSLNQEIFFIEKINELVNKGLLIGSKYKYIKVRPIEMLRDLDYTSKLDRSPSFIQGMMAYGEEQADDFLKRVS
ncbi:MAG: patatin-like phospholipase family protein [Thermodesulfobacteriota bacterium]